MKPPKSHSMRVACSKVWSFWSGERRAWVRARARLGRAGARPEVLAGGRWRARFDTNGGSAHRYTALDRRRRLKTWRLGLLTIGPIRGGPLRLGSVTIRLPRIVPIRRRGTRVTSVTIARRTDGEWWAGCTVERRLRPPRRPSVRAGDALGWEPETTAAAGGLAAQSRDRHESTRARLVDHPLSSQVERSSLSFAPYSQLAMNALSTSAAAPALAESGSAEGMARLRRTSGRLQRFLTLGSSS